MISDVSRVAYVLEWEFKARHFSYTLAEDQRMKGAIIMHIFGAFYFFTLLAVVCNDYFLPTIECICEDLKISPVRNDTNCRRD